MRKVEAKFLYFQKLGLATLRARVGDPDDLARQTPIDTDPAALLLRANDAIPNCAQQP